MYTHAHTPVHRTGTASPVEGGLGTVSVVRSDFRLGPHEDLPRVVSWSLSPGFGGGVFFF